MGDEWCNWNCSSSCPCIVEFGVVVNATENYSCGVSSCLMNLVHLSELKVGASRPLLPLQVIFRQNR